MAHHTVPFTMVVIEENEKINIYILKHKLQYINELLQKTK